MILALSVENTNLVMGCFDGENLLFTSRLAADRNKTGDEYAISFKSILDMHGIEREDITGSIVARQGHQRLCPSLRRRQIYGRAPVPEDRPHRRGQAASGGTAGILRVPGAQVPAWQRNYPH